MCVVHVSRPAQTLGYMYEYASSLPAALSEPAPGQPVDQPAGVISRASDTNERLHLDDQAFQSREPARAAFSWFFTLNFTTVV